MNLRYLSLFSGIEAATVAWKPLGWEAAAFAQYEPNDKIQFPSKVLEYHYPDVPNLGDVTKISEEQIKALGHIDLVVGGSPCQDLSIAGLRRGLVNEDGSLTRSGLFDYQMQIFEWARRNNGCEWMLWENVPGAFSSNEGNDFGYILGSMVQRDVPIPKDGWKNSGVCISESGDRIVEWRVLDAQHFGVPQRRRRIFALLHTGAWGGYPPVLFESESVSRDFEEGKRTQQSPTSSFGENSSENGCIGWNTRNIRGSRVTENSMNPLCATQFKGTPLNGYKADAISTGDFIGVGKDVCPTLTRRDYKDPNVVGYPEKSSVCVDDFGQNCIDAVISIIDGKEYEKAIAIRTANTKANGNGILKDQAHTVACTQPEVVAYRPNPTSSNSMKSTNSNSGFHKEKVFVKGTRPHSKDEVPTWKEGTVANTLNTFDLGETRCNELVCEKQKVPILNFQGSKGNSIAEESNTMYTLNAMHGHDVHCIVDFQESLFDD